MSQIGDNNPPSAIEFCAETTAELGRWLEDHPVIQNEDDARAGKLLVDRASTSIKDAEAERDGIVRPLNEQVKDINNTYRGPREALERISGLLRERLAAYIKAEREKREKEAEDRRLALEAAEKRAREAEEREREAKEDADAGVVDSGVAAAVMEADSTFTAFKKAERELARAEKETKVKIGGGFQRAISLRTKEILVLNSWRKAIDEMGLSEALIEAILKEARAFRKANDRLPVGVSATTEEIL